MREMISDFFRFLGEYRRPILKIVIFLLILFVAYNGVFFISLNHPKSCTVCHYMDPYYEQWKSSSHNGVKCLKCHTFKPLFITVTTVKYLTGTYNPRPHAVVKDDSCLSKGCHSLRLEKPEVPFAEEVVFDHKEHMEKLKRGEKLTCTSCHYQVVQGEHMTVDSRVCFLCHFKGTGPGQAVGGCTSCHRNPGEVETHVGFRFNHAPYLKRGLECHNCHLRVAEGTGKVEKDRCYSCHVERKREKLDRISLHKIHVTGQHLPCLSCHEEIRHEIVEMAKMFGGNCTSCHGSLHEEKEEIYMGTGARGIPPSPSLMFVAQVACDGCHKGAVRGETKGERQISALRQTCVECHSTEYGKMLNTWMTWGERIIKETKKVRARGRVLLAKAKEKGIKDAVSLLEDISANAELLERGVPAHNITFAWEIARTAYTQYSIAAGYLGEKPLPLPDFLSSPEKTCISLCHGDLGIPGDVEVESLGTAFPHSTHREDLGLPCTRCHTPEKHRVEKFRPGECTGCHHGGEAELECATCHVKTSALYAGKSDGNLPPSEMFEAEVNCTDCHGEGSHISADTRKIRERCIECHDESYGETLEEWLDASAEVRKRGEKLLEELLLVTEKRENPDEKALLEETRKLVSSILAANPVHNLDGAEKALAEGEKALRKE
ncbi:MAG: hypothetical protein D6713_02880 [Deltaproteobacteria bacterium]|nr:MAG: hypothetical protein D6713_02880 [Deltaproteobacteria bacterium]